MGDKEMFDVPSASSTHSVRHVSCRLLASNIKPRLEEIIGSAGLAGNISTGCGILVDIVSEQDGPGKALRRPDGPRPVPDA